MKTPLEAYSSSLVYQTHQIYQITTTFYLVADVKADIEAATYEGNVTTKNN